jgi:hypothetical protein
MPTNVASSSTVEDEATLVASLASGPPLDAAVQAAAGDRRS